MNVFQHKNVLKLTEEEMNFAQVDESSNAYEDVLAERNQSVLSFFVKFPYNKTN